MREQGIGRVLVASLHEALAEVLPTRFEFYESFLPASGLSGGTISVAAFSAVLSFLRQEGGAYDRITMRAGEHAAEWTVQSLAAYERATINAAPAWLRARLVLRLARRLVRTTCETSRASTRLRKGTARIQLRNSIFCTVREPYHQPLCRFYVAAVTRLLSLFGLAGAVTVEGCRATGASGSPCVMCLSLSVPEAKGADGETAA